jgi:phage terminase large subunit
MAWEYEWIEDANVFSREPVHNWASHPSDAFAYGAQVIAEHVVESNETKPIRGIEVGNNAVTLDELYRTVNQTRKRY